MGVAVASCNGPQNSSSAASSHLDFNFDNFDFGVSNSDAQWLDDNLIRLWKRGTYATTTDHYILFIIITKKNKNTYIPFTNSIISQICCIWACDKV